jgi:hypothetical protein
VSEWNARRPTVDARAAPLRLRLRGLKTANAQCPGMDSGCCWRCSTRDHRSWARWFPEDPGGVAARLPVAFINEVICLIV